MRPDIIIESCCETIEECLIAERNGATRIEFCASLDQQGLTPSLESLSKVIDLVSIPVRPIIRPSNSFVVDNQELQRMIKSIQYMNGIKIDGIVLGLLDIKGRVDIEKLQQIISFTQELPITFHKAIDHSSDILEDVAILEQFHSIDTILTSGGKSTVSEGLDMILDMQKLSSKTIMAGGSVTKQNLNLIHKKVGLQAYHGRKIV